MNMNPDEVTLALWLDDELTGPEMAKVEAWASQHPEQLAAREGIRRWRATFSAAIPVSEEPPYPDFFNRKVLQGIREQTPKPVVPEKRPGFWKSWLMPTVACAGMALTFWAGTKSNPVPEINVAGAPRAIPVDPVLYTPETGVNAELFASRDASATVIVLSGVTAIPDATDFSETVYVPMDREFDSTADTEVDPTWEVGR
ncbi:MAG: anti-sigma factor family protein [Luteolibacter sp.]